jgi:hypothetical protein
MHFRRRLFFLLSQGGLSKAIYLRPSLSKRRNQVGVLFACHAIESGDCAYMDAVSDACSN